MAVNQKDKPENPDDERFAMPVPLMTYIDTDPGMVLIHVHAVAQDFEAPVVMMTYSIDDDIMRMTANLKDAHQMTSDLICVLATMGSKWADRLHDEIVKMKQEQDSK